MTKETSGLWCALRLLKKNNAITRQEFNVYKGQILSGNPEACIRGLKRKGLIVCGQETSTSM